MTSIDPSLPARAHAALPKTGVLLVNLGTPDAPTKPAIRRYLRQFLGDPRVVEVPRAIWLPILHLFILPFRPSRLAHAYASVWTAEGSPLLSISQRQTDAIRADLALRFGQDVPVALAMTYGSPSIASALAELAAANVRRIVLLPLYPQYSGSTTSAVYDAVFDELRTLRWVPELRTIGSYHDRPDYIAALADSVRAQWQREGRADHLLISFHGVPQRYVRSGDPYYCHCQKTARLLTEALALAPDAYSVAFQSRLGRAPWVQPYTDQLIPKLVKAGVKSLDVICPAFAADCLETLEEVSIRYADDFKAAGGDSFRYIPALNDAPVHIEMLGSLLSTALSGWMLEPSTTEDIRARQQRAAELEPAFTGTAKA
jgi:ferrochelatase